MTDFPAAVLEPEDDIEVVAQVSNGREVLEQARSLRPDVILLDIAMPKLNGPTLYRAVRQTDPSARFLFTSGYTASDIEQRSLVEPGVLFVAKPWTITELARQVRRALDAPATRA